MPAVSALDLSPVARARDRVFIAPGDFGGWTPSLVTDSRPDPDTFRGASRRSQPTEATPASRTGERDLTAPSTIPCRGRSSGIDFTGPGLASDLFDEVSEDLDFNGVFVG